MRKIILICFLLSAILGNAQVCKNSQDFCNSFSRLQITGGDTVTYKTNGSLTIIEGVLYVANGAKWSQVTGGGGFGLQEVLSYNNRITRNDSIRGASFNFVFDSLNGFKTNYSTTTTIQQYSKPSVTSGSGASASTALLVQGGSGGSTTATTGSYSGGNAGAINIFSGNGGSALSGVSGTSISGNGGLVYLLAGDAGQNIAGVGATKIYGSGGSAIIQAGNAYGGNAGGFEMKSGNNLVSGARGGSSYFVAGYGNNNNSDNPLYNGALYFNVSSAGQVRGNAIIGSSVDDAVHRLQVGGKAIVSDSLEAGSLKRTGGLSTQYLMADGSVTTGGGGSGGLSGGNIGSGFRIYLPSAQGVKTMFGNFGLTFDSVSNSNGLTLTIDSSKWATAFSNSQKYTLDSTSIFGGLKTIFKAYQDSLSFVALNNLNVHTTGNQSISGIKTFTTSVLSDQFASIADTSINIVAYSIGAAKIQNVYFNNGILQVGGTSYGAMNSGLLSFNGGAFHIGSYGTTYDIVIEAPNTRISNNLYIASLTGLLKSTSGLVSTATSGTDYQAPVTLTTTGTGAATFVSNVLNIPTPTVGVSSVSNSDGTLTISPTTGAVVASLGLSHANTWTGQQTFNTSAPVFGTMTAGSILFAGTSGLLSQDNSTLSWDNINKKMGIGTNNPGAAALMVVRSTVSDGIATLQNTSTGGYSTLSLLDNSGTKKFEIGYGNSAVSYTPLQNRGYFNAATDFAMLMNGVEAMTLAASTANVGIRNLAPNSSLQVSGSLATAYVSKTSTYSISATDYTIDCTSGTFTVTLPTAVGITGRMYSIKNSSIGVITIATTASQTIDGSTTQPITAGNPAMIVQSTGANWIVLSN